MQTTQSYRTLTFSPCKSQFVIDELPLLMLCLTGLVYGGLSDALFTGLSLALSVLLFLCLEYRFIYMLRIRYHIGSEQLIREYGVLRRSVDYMELYRVVDFAEHQTLLQQLLGLKTVTMFSMDRSTPRLEIIGIDNKTDIVRLIRERVETNKRRKGIHEITNR